MQPFAIQDCDPVYKDLHAWHAEYWQRCFEEIKLGRTVGELDELCTSYAAEILPENLKGRVALSLESTGARMNRLGAEVLAGMPLLSLDETVERIEGVTIDELGSLVEELWAPGRLSAAGIGPDRERFEQALAAVDSRLVESA